MSRKDNDVAVAPGIDDLVHQVRGLDLDPDSDDDLRKVACWIQESSRILVLTGAGVSCAAGIPDFRTPGTGLYDNLQSYGLPYAEAVFDVSFYRTSPRPFLNLARALWPGLKHSPTLTHSFLATLAHRKKLLRNYSQNIDGLEHLATLPEECLVECHGHFRTASCIRCKTPMDGELCKKIILETDEIPMCTNSKCNNSNSNKNKSGRSKGGGAYVKPDIVFFGEGLPARYHALSSKDVEDADLLIVMGTSLSVGPVNTIPQRCRTQRRILINRDAVRCGGGATFDAVLLGDCDEIVMRVARRLGWEEQVRKLNRQTTLTAKKGKSKKDASKEDEKK